MIHPEPVDYELSLSTGEKLKISELDCRNIPELLDPTITLQMKGILSRCTFIKHSDLQDAKRGYTENLEKVLKTPPIGALQNIDKPICSQIKSCSMANHENCTTKNLKGKTPMFPECWEYSSLHPDASLLSSVIVREWRDNRYVLIVSGD